MAGSRILLPLTTGGEGRGWKERGRGGEEEGERRVTGGREERGGKEGREEEGRGAERRIKTSKD